MPRFCCKTYERGGDFLVAFCDSGLVGDVFEEEGRRLAVKESFYCGDDVDRDELIALLRGATIINATGEDSVSLLIELEMVEEDAVITVDGVPHAQMVLLK